MSQDEYYEVINPYELYYHLQGKPVKSTYANYLAGAILFLGLGSFLTFVIENWLGLVGTTGNFPFPFPVIATICIGSLAIGSVLFVQLLWIVLLDVNESFVAGMVLKKKAFAISRPLPQLEARAGEKEPKPQVIRVSRPSTVIARYRIESPDNIISSMINPVPYAMLSNKKKRKTHRHKGKESPK